MKTLTTILLIGAGGLFCMALGGVVYSLLYAPDNMSSALKTVSGACCAVFCATNAFYIHH